MDTPSIPELSPEEARKAKKRAYNQAYHRANRERILTQKRLYLDKHREENKTRCRENHAKNHAARLAQQRHYRQANRARIRARDQRYRSTRAEAFKLYMQRYYALHHQHIRQAQQTYAIRHRDAKRAADFRYRQEHLEEKRAADRAYRLAHVDTIRVAKRQRAQTPHGKRLAKESQDRRRARKARAAMCDFTVAQWDALCKAVGYRCTYCGKRFPAEDLTRDHLTSYAKGGNHTLANILPACRPCNSRKAIGSAPKLIQPFLLVDDAAAD